MVEKHFSYDPWGKDRDPLTGADDPSRIYPFSPADSPTSRGFSDHEKLPGTGLINMNARLYDPEIGRFLSADSVTQSIYVSVALNRYAYCGNNPLSYTDPTGHLFGIDDIFGWVAVGLGIFSFFSDDPWIDTLAAIAIGWQFGPYGSWQLANEGASALVGGLIAGGVTSGGNVKSALIGAGSAYAFHLVGGPIKEGLHIREGSAATFGERLASAGLHGMVGGLVSVAQGGKFASGFISAGFSNLAGSYSPFGEGAGTLAYVAIVGGISSELGGGKFANGAVTAAFGYLYNGLGIKKAVNRVMDILREYEGLDLIAAAKETRDNLDRRLPKFARTILFGGINGTIAGVAAVTGAGGTYWDRNSGKIGTFKTWGGGVGYDVSVGGIFGFITGGAEDLAGYAWVLEGDSPLYAGGSVLVGTDIISLPGAAAKLFLPTGAWGVVAGPGVGAGAALTLTNTTTQCVLYCEGNERR